MSEFVEGSSVTFLGKNGWTGEALNAKKIGLEVGPIYTVSDTNRTDISSHISLHQFPGYFFNAVMFERVASDMTNMELACRELCRVKGIDPDEMVNYNHGTNLAVSMKTKAWKREHDEILRVKRVVDLINKYNL